MFYSFRQTNARFTLNLGSRTLECHTSLIIYCMTHVHLACVASVPVRSKRNFTFGPHEKWDESKKVEGSGVGEGKERLFPLPHPLPFTFLLLPHECKKLIRAARISFASYGNACYAG